MASKKYESRCQSHKTYNESSLISVGKYTDESSLEVRTICSKNNNDGSRKTLGGNMLHRTLEAMEELGAESSHAISGDETSATEQNTTNAARAAAGDVPLGTDTLTVSIQEKQTCPNVQSQN